MAQFFRPCDQGAVAGNLIMLDGLGIGDNGRVQDSLVFDLARGRVGPLIRPSIAGQSVPLGC